LAEARRLSRDLHYLAKPVLENRSKQVVLRREPAEDRCDTDACAFSDLRDTGLDALLREHRARGLEDEAAIALGVRAEGGHAAAATGSSASWICPTSRLRTMAASTTIAPSIHTAPIRKARRWPR